MEFTSLFPGVINCLFPPLPPICWDFLDSLSSSLLVLFFHLVKSIGWAASFFSWRFSCWHFTSSCSSLFFLVLGPGGHSPSNSLCLCCVRSPVSWFLCLPFSCFTFLFWWSTSCSSFLWKYMEGNVFEAYSACLKCLSTTFPLDWAFWK